MASDSTKVVPLRRAPVKKRGPVEQVIHDIQVGLPGIIQLGKDATERVKSGYRKVKAFLR